MWTTARTALNTCVDTLCSVLNEHNSEHNSEHKRLLYCTLLRYTVLSALVALVLYIPKGFTRARADTVSMDSSMMRIDRGVD